MLAGGGPADVVELTVALAREMLDAAGISGRGPGGGPGRRLGDGRLAPDDHRPGRRPGRAAAPGAREQHVVTAPGVRRPDPPGRLRRRRRPPGASARAGPARRTRCRPARASSCTPSRATRSRAGQPLLTLHTDTPEGFAYALEALEGAYETGPSESFTATPLILDRIGNAVSPR